jgi:hypothetical protein
MSKRSADPVAIHFQSCLKVKPRPDGNSTHVVAKGDCAIMLQLIRMKLDDFDARIDPVNPGRFRGTSQLESDMKRVLGSVRKIHITKWGASHMRGALRNDEKRGNKRHLIELVDLLNSYEGTPSQLQLVYDDCISRHHRFWDGFSLKVLTQADDPFQKQLLSLLSLHSLGRVQQGLVFSALRRRYGSSRRITTKKTFAADEQSSLSGQTQRGDIQVWSDETVALVLEIKDAIVDKTAWARVEATHATHDYALFVLGNGYRPATLQQEISSSSSTFALHLEDFVLTLIFMIAADENRSPKDVLSEILLIYNEEFCLEIEDDASIRIKIDFIP